MKTPGISRRKFLGAAVAASLPLLPAALRGAQSHKGEALIEFPTIRVSASDTPILFDPDGPSGDRVTLKG